MTKVSSSSPSIFFPLVADGRLRKPRKALSYLQNVIKAKWVQIRSWRSLSWGQPNVLIMAQDPH